MPEGIFLRGVLYAYGRGEPKDEAVALEVYLRAAESGSPDAQGMLGWIHEVGRGAPKDLAESVRWFRLAAAQGIVAACDHLKYLETMEKRPTSSGNL